VKTSREPKLPGLPRSEPDEDADTGVVALPWEKPESVNADSFAAREQQAVAVLGDPEISTTLRGAPDTVKLGAQTWKPPASSSQRAEINDTVKLSAQTWQPPAPTPGASIEARLPEDGDETTDIVRSIPTVVHGEGDAEVAGVIRADDGPARIVSHPPNAAASAVPTEAPRSVELSPSVAHVIERREATPVPRPYESTPTPVPRVRAPMSDVTPIPYELSEANTFGAVGGAVPEMTPAPRAPQAPRAIAPPRPADATAMVHTRPASPWLVITVALISAMLGLGAGYMLWGLPASRSNAVGPTAVDSSGGGSTLAETPVLAPTEPGLKPENCKLVITTTPDEATVRAGDVNLGKTPIDAELACGELEVKISKRQYSTAVEKLSLSAGQATKLAVELERPTYKLSVQSIPRGAAIKVNGTDSGTTPKTVELPGFEEAEIELSRRGYKVYKTTVTPKRRRTVLKPRLRRR
jgi:hypothetical protein